MKLYEVSRNILEFESLCESGQIPEEAIKDTLDSINMEFEEKADNIASLIKNNAAHSKALKEEANNLYKRANSKDKSNKFLSNYLLENMKLIEKMQIETNRNKINIRKNPESIELEINFIEWASKNNADHFLKYKEPLPNKTAIKEALKSGDKIPFAKLVKNERIEIK